MTGPALKNQQSGMGIVKAKGPCWCESDDYDYDYMVNVDDADIICQCAPTLKIASVIIARSITTFTENHDFSKIIHCVHNTNINTCINLNTLNI